LTFQAFETSTEAGCPVEVFRFQVGSTEYYYTSAEDEVTLASQLYVPKAISRADNAEGPANRDHDFAVVLPTSDPVAQFFTGNLPGKRVRLTVSRFHRDDTPTPEVVVIFDGRVMSAGFRKKLKETVLTARPLLSSVGRVMPARTCQSQCNHTLYDPNTCKVDDTDPAFRAAAKNVAGQSGNLLAVGGLGAYAAGWFTGGYVEDIANSDFRTILDDDGAGNLTLLLPFATQPSTVNVFAGCAHDIAVCKSKFDNVINFGGFAFVPRKNPFETGVV
jgi:hypothetical protein